MSGPREGFVPVYWVRVLDALHEYGLYELTETRSFSDRLRDTLRSGFVNKALLSRGVDPDDIWATKDDLGWWKE